MKKTIYISVIILFIIFLPSETISQEIKITDKNKENTVKEISDLINNYYVLKEKRNDIVSKLATKYSDGSYDTIRTVKSFANQITRDLHDISSDYHFAVVYDPMKVHELRNDDNEETDAEELKQYQIERFEKRKKNNFGFKRVEVLDGNIGYLKFDFFREDSIAIEIAHSAMEFISNSDAIIFDLRNNHGGGVSMFTLLTSYFFGKDSILLGRTYNSLNNQTDESWTNPKLPRKKFPCKNLYILISKETFSAAEAFAYALKHLKRAIIIGENSGGGAEMATRMIINDDFYMYMPFAAAINPITNSNWEGTGVIPDIKTSADSALIVAHKIALQDLIGKSK